MASQASRDSAEENGGLTYRLKLSGLPAASTVDTVEVYLSATFDEVTEATLLGGGTAIAQVVYDGDIQEFLRRKHRIKKHAIEVTLADPVDLSVEQTASSVTTLIQQSDVMETEQTSSADVLATQSNVSVVMETQQHPSSDAIVTQSNLSDAMVTKLSSLSDATVTQSNLSDVMETQQHPSSDMVTQSDHMVTKQSTSSDAMVTQSSPSDDTLPEQASSLYVTSTCLVAQDVYPDLIEVTGDNLPETGILQCYFEGEHAGGQADKEIEFIKKIDEGVVHIKFESVDDAAAVVAQEKHMFMKKPLRVRFVPIPPSSPPPPPKLYEKDKLLITDIPSGVRKDFLAAIIEGRLGLDDETDFTIDLRSSVAILLLKKSYNDEELVKMAEKIMKKKINKTQSLTVRQCEVNHSVVVTGISNESFVTEEAMFAYFETPRSGGGEDLIEEVKMLSKETAKVTFKDFTVIQRVLEKKHEKLGASVIVTACTVLDSLESSGESCTSSEEEESEKEEIKSKRDSKTGEKERYKSEDKGDKEEKRKGRKKSDKPQENEEETDSPPLKKRKAGKKSKKSQESEDTPPPPLIEEKPPAALQHPPIMHPLDPLLAKYVRCKPAITAGIEKEYQVSMTVNEQMGTITISPSPSSPPDWPDKAVEMMHDVFSGSLTKVDILVPPEAASSIYPMLMKVCNESGLQLAFGQGSNKVAVAGDIDSVTKLQNDVEELTSRLIKKIDEVQIPAEDYAYLKGHMLPVIQQYHPNVQLQCNDDSFTVLVSGTLRDVTELKQKFAHYLSHAKVPVDLHPMAVRFLSEVSGRQVLHNLVERSRVVVPYFNVSSGDNQSTLFLLCPNDSLAQGKAIATNIQKEVAHKNEGLPQAFQVQLAETSKFNSFKANLAERYVFFAAVHKGQLVIVSTARNVEAVSGELMRFIKEECSVTDNIHLKRGVWRLFHTSSMEKKWTDLVNDIREKGVQINSLSKPTSKKPFLQIKGEMQDVEYAKEKILALQADVKERQIPISRPGICQYFFKNEMSLKGIESEAKVCIEVGTKEESGANLPASNDPHFDKVCFGTTIEQKVVSVFVGDITEFSRAEVIVNAANEDLLHGGGVAASISKKGGPVIQRDSTDYISSRSKLSIGDAILFTNVGNLPHPYKAIVHAVGPRWNQSGDNKREVALLKKAVRKSLEKARDYSSIALPAISSGIFGFPVDVCASSLLEGVIEFSKAEPRAKLNEINFVIFQDNADMFVQAAEKHLKTFHCSGSSQQQFTPPSTPVNDTSDKRRRRRASEPVSVIAFKSMKITKGSIIDFQEEVLVNTTDTKLGFGGFVAQALAKAAGPGLQQECEKVPKPVNVGSVVTTKGHNLKSKHVLHVVLPGYDGPGAENVLRQVVQKCLTECTRLKVKSLSMPSIGAGNLRYPNDVVAKALIEETASYLEKNCGKTTLELVHFVIFDPKIHDEFCQVYRRASTGFARPASLSPPSGHSASRTRSQERVQRPFEMECFPLLHDLKLELLQGDISCDDSDVIVNTTQENLQLVGSGVSGALLKKGGPELQGVCKEAFAKGQKATEGKVVVTGATGDLKCKMIFHIVFRDGKKFSKTIQACLEQAEKKKCHSIAFPAVGTGVHGYPAADAAKAVVEALKKFTDSKPKHLKVIRMVVFQSDIYRQFVTAFKSMGDSSGGLLSNLYSGIKAFGSYLTGSSRDENGENGDEEHFEDFEDTDEITEMFSLPLGNSEVILHIYGQTDQAVARAEKKLKAIIDTQFVTENMENPNIVSLSDSTVTELEVFAKKHSVDIDIDRDPNLNSVKLYGCLQDVLVVKDRVRDALSSMTQEKSQKLAAEMLYKTVRWIRLTSQEEEEEYGEELNYEIEQVYKTGDKFYESKEEKFSIDFERMKEKDSVTRKKVMVKRLDLTEDKPEYWDPMPKDSQGREKHVHLVTLAPGSPEYTRVETAFNKTMTLKIVGIQRLQNPVLYQQYAMTGCYKQIVSIQRLQNPVLYQQYVVRKREMDKHNPKGHMNERWLWHGTSYNTLDMINTQGFNRSFAGKNATVYGKGVYFARDSSYSNSYTTPDANGYRHMYYTRVLTGEFTVGNTAMVVPPAKNPQVDPNILFDSTVDNVTNPTIFVVYQDSQNYPDYMVNYY